MSKDTYKVQEFDEKDAEDLDILNTEIKINPSFYIHLNLIKAQDALLKEDYKQGFMQYFACAKHLLILCRAGNMIGDTFEDEYQKEKQKINKKDNIDLITKMFQEGLFLYDVLVKEVFSSRKVTTPLQLKRNNRQVQSLDEANERYKKEQHNK